jgi:hypothetical protein
MREPMGNLCGQAASADVDGEDESCDPGRRVTTANEFDAAHAKLKAFMGRSQHDRRVATDDPVVGRRA